VLNQSLQGPRNADVFLHHRGRAAAAELSRWAALIAYHSVRDVYCTCTSTN
jgi:hypothetical protein